MNDWRENGAKGDTTCLFFLVISLQMPFRLLPESLR